MRELRESYRVGGLPARIRLQSELSDRWENQVPTAIEVIEQIADKAAPPEHRVYVAHLFRNLTKMDRVEAKEAADVVDRMLSIVGDSKEDPLLRGQLAVTLANFDKSSAAVRSAATLLDVPSDDAGYMAATALRHTASDQAAKALYEFLKRDIAKLDQKPRTASAALLALTGYGKLDIVPITKDILNQTEVPELFLGTLTSLAKSKSSTAVVDALVAAYDRPVQIRGIDSERAKAASLRALRQHSGYLDSVAQQSGTSQKAVLERARQILGK